METDRNLLFALLALQLEYIDSERFTIACAAWSAAKEKPLADTLIERGWLTQDQRAEIERQLENKLNQHDSDADKTQVADATVDSRPMDKTVVQGNVEETDDSTSSPASESRSTSDLLEATTAMESNSNVDSVESEDTQGYGPEDAGYVQVDTMQWEPENERTRYTFTRMHGEGGIGRVWLAHDQHLNRQVALKEIRPDKEQSKAAWTRFVREAQITSQLEHPNIVPVYELSNRRDDQGSFYTMRFVRGDTLRNAIDTYHRHRREGTATELELRSLLSSFVLVCHAMGYAHSRGVLHRDLKPSNIMLGPFGEVVVLDWGLAKMVHHDNDDDDDLMEAGPVGVTAEAAIDATQQGAILGTLPYMAPEQAAGRLDKIDSRTDIYGLGAILFAILTGNHPHKGTTTREVRSRIIKEPTPRVRSQDSAAHPVLDAICGKAMAKKRAGRYTKAGELADDVQRWLADEPVSCFRDSAASRAARWLRKHRTWARAIAGALFLVTLVSVIAAVLIEQARRGEELAKADATARFLESRETVDKMVTGVNDNLKEFPGMQPLRLRLLEEAARKYKSYAEDDGANGPVKLEAARSLLRLADIYVELAKDDDAETTYNDAKTRLLDIIGEHPHLADARLELANARAKLGLMYAQQGEKEQALSLYGEALRELAELIATGDPDGTYEYTSAGVVVNQADLLNRTDEEREGIELLHDAIATFERLANTRSDDRFIDGLATARTNLGNVLQSLGRSSEAIVLLEEAVTAFKQLSLANPDVARYLEHAAAARLNLAVALGSLGRDREERQAYRDTLKDYELLLADRSDVPLYLERQAMTKIHLGIALHIVGNNREAVGLLEQGISETQHLLDTRLGLATYHFQWALGNASLGRVLGELNDSDGALACLGDALDVYTALIEGDPNLATRYRTHRAVTQSATGIQYLRMKETASARTALIAAKDEIKSLYEANTDSDQLKHVLAWSLTYLAELEWTADNRAKASSYYEEAISLRESLLREPEHRYDFARLLTTCQDPEQANAKRAVQLADKLATDVPDNARYATALGASHVRAGEIAEAIKVLVATDDLSPQGGTEHDFWLAIAFLARDEDADEGRAKNRLESAITRMELEAPQRRTLLRLRAEAEGSLPAADTPAAESSQ